MKKFSKREKLLFVSPILLLALPLVSMVREEISRDAMDKAMQKLGGPSALNCGTRGCGVDKVGAATQCTLSALKNRKPFYCRVTYGSIYSEGFAMTPQERLYVIGHERGRWGTDGQIFDFSLAKSFRPNAGTGFNVTDRTHLSDPERSKLLRE
jgi:hypothetical protein